MHQEERLRMVGKTLADALLNTVPMQGDLQREDQARILCKILETFKFSKYFPLDTSVVSILHYLMDKLEEYANKLVDPLVTDQYIKDLPLEDLKGVLTARRGQLCTLVGVAEDGSEQPTNWGAQMGGCFPTFQDGGRPDVAGNAGSHVGPALSVRSTSAK